MKLTENQKQTIKIKLRPIIESILKEESSVNSLYRKSLEFVIKNEFKNAPPERLKGTNLQKEIDYALKAFDAMDDAGKKELYSVHSKISALQEKNPNVNLEKYAKDDSALLKERKRRFIALCTILNDLYDNAGF